MPPHAAGDVIRAMVCGYASSARAKKLMVMLQAFVDDSASEFGDKRLFLAGYVDRAERWAALSDAWERELKKHPAIAYFKMTEAENFRGQFKSWSKSDRDRKVLALAGIVDTYRPLAIHCSVSREEYSRIVEPVAPWPLKSPYFSCFWGVIEVTAGYHRSLGVEDVPSVDFIFDEQGRLGDQAADWYRWLKDDQDSSIRDLLGTTPIFRDDKKVVALQAADMLAWHIRRDHERNGTEIREARQLLIATSVSKYIDAAALEGIAKKFSRVPSVSIIQTKASWRVTQKAMRAQIAAGLGPPSTNRAWMLWLSAKFRAAKLINRLLHPRR